jgi:hypothetical protein
MNNSITNSLYYRATDNPNLDNVQYILEYFSSPYNILIYATMCSILNQIDTQESLHFEENSDFTYSFDDIIDDSDINIYNINDLLYSDDTSKRKVASPDIINNIELISFTQTNNDTVKECPITLELFTSESKIAKLPCSHIFSYEAIYTWLSENSNKCPCCRYEYDWVEK